jgi:hypothetical protein
MKTQAHEVQGCFGLKLKRCKRAGETFLFRLATMRRLDLAVDPATHENRI